MGSPKKKAKDPETEQLQAVLRARLKELIERFPGRQTELAERAGLKQSNISETFNHMPTLAKAVKICRAGGVTLDWLAGGRDAIPLELRPGRPADKVVDKLSTRGKIRLQPSLINVSLLEYILKVVRGLDFWNELNPEEQAERVAQTYQALLADQNKKQEPSRAKIISILRGRKTA